MLSTPFTQLHEHTISHKESWVTRNQMMTVPIALDQLHYNSIIGIANGLYIILEDMCFCIIVITRIVLLTFDKIFSFSRKQQYNIVLVIWIIILAIVCIWTNNVCYNQVSTIHQRRLMFPSASRHLPRRVHSLCHQQPLNKTAAVDHFVMVCFIVYWTGVY